MRRSSSAAIAAVVAIAVIALIGLVVLRTPTSSAPSVSPSASVVSASATASATPSASATPTATAPPSSSPSGVVAARPDARHGVIVATGGLRTEDDPRSLQQPSLFATASSASYSVSPDGKQVALVRTSQTGQQIVSFTTARPNDVTTLVDLAGSGEVAGHLVWAGDGAQRLLVQVEKQSRGSGGGDNLIIDYSTLRSVDVTTHAVVEIARVSGQNNSLWPLAWLPGRQLAAALEVRPLGPVGSFVLVRGGAIERTPMSPSPSVASFNASRDGTRILMFTAAFVRWWPVDQPQSAKDLMAQAGETLGRAELRPGSDEIGVDVGGRLEVWSLSGQRRVVARQAGTFLDWRVDGTAAITSPDPSTVLLVDPSTGVMTPLPGGGFPVTDVVLF